MAQNIGFTLWLTGMLGAGKTTMANYLSARLRQVGRAVEVLDEADLGDILWAGANDTKEDRIMIVQRLGWLAELLTRNGVAAIVAATSPYKASREANRRSISKYIEVYVDCPTEKLIARDTTGKYKKALAGEIPNFIGITEPFEPPTSPEVHLQTDLESVEESGRKIFQALLDLSCMSADELKVITGKRMRANPLPRKARGRAGKGARAARPARAARVVKAARRKR